MNEQLSIVLFYHFKKIKLKKLLLRKWHLDVLRGFSKKTKVNSAIENIAEFN